jgi:hypothetical protein
VIEEKFFEDKNGVLFFKNRSANKKIQSNVHVLSCLFVFVLNTKTYHWFLSRKKLDFSHVKKKRIFYPHIGVYMGSKL